MEIKVSNFILANPFQTAETEIKLEFIYPALQEFKKLKLPINEVQNIVKSIKEVERALEEYEKMRIIILESLAEKDENEKPVLETENGQQNYKLSEEGKLEWNKKFSELLNQQVTVNIFPIKKSALAKVKEISIGSYETLLKYGFIEDDDKKS